MYTKQFLWSIILLIMQVLIFNHVQIYGYGTPLICILPILLFPLSAPRWLVLVVAFIFGIIEDSFINTPGISAASFTLIGMIQPTLLKILSPRDEDDENKGLSPSSKTMSWENYSIYIALNVLILAFAFFTLEAFSFFNFQKYIISIASSWGITTLMILAIESLRSSNKSSSDR